MLLVAGASCGGLLHGWQCQPRWSRASSYCCDVQPDKSIEAGIEAFLSKMKAEGGDRWSDDGWNDDYGIEEDGDDDGWVESERFEQELLDELSYPAKALAEQRFLGAGEALEMHEDSQSAVAAAAAISETGQGVVRLKEVLSVSLAAELREFAISEMRVARRAQQAVADGVATNSREVRLSNVLAPEVRWDVRLPMKSVVRRALRELLGSDAPLGGAFEIACGGQEAELWELSAMISAPGAASQIVHADCDGAPNPPLLFTCFVALQPVTRALGPTRWLPTTHCDAAAHMAVNAHGDATVLRGADGTSPPLSRVGLLSTGDASLYDGRILHCGGTNSAGGPDDGDGLRVLFYLTFRHADALETGLNPAARSLLTRYSGRVTLGMLRDAERGFDGYLTGGLDWEAAD